MVTKEQALKCSEFHTCGCSRTVGKRGGIKEAISRWRRNGATQTWKTRTDAFRIPVKKGIAGYGEINNRNAQWFHAAEDCPLNGKGEGNAR